MNSELRRIEARGGAPQTITYLAGRHDRHAWGSDGTILFSSTASPSLRRVNAAGGAVQVETTPAAESTGHRHPQFLPGGRQFLFFVGGPDAVRGVYLGALGSSDVTRLVASDTQGAYVAPGWLLFVRQGTLWAQHFDLGQRTMSGEPIAVADSVAFEPIDGTGAFSTSDAGVLTYRAGRPTMTRLSWFDRSGNRARHAWIVRTDWADEPPSVAGRPSRGRRTLAPERNRRVAARFLAPDAVHPRV